MYQLGCAWTDNGCMFLYQSINVLVNSIDIVTNVTHLKTISNIGIPTYCIMILPSRKTGKYTTNTPCMYEVEINKIIGVQTPHKLSYKWYT